MTQPKIAVIGIGATGIILSSALLKKFPETVLVGRREDQMKDILEKGIVIKGEIESHIKCKNFLIDIKDLEKHEPDVIFLCSKTFHLTKILDDLKGIVKAQTKIVSTHNGLGTEEVIAEKFGIPSTFRMTLNYGAALQSNHEASVAFFNKPNHLGALTVENKDMGDQLAEILTMGDLDTEFVEDIKHFVWKKMILKCSMASLCAVTDKTIIQLLENPSSRVIADACFQEALSVAKAMGYEMGEDYLEQSTKYLSKVGIHKDSICVDIANKSPTEIDFLGGKVVEYAKLKGIPVPHYETMTHLVRSIETSY